MTIKKSPFLFCVAALLVAFTATAQNQKQSSGGVPLDKSLEPANQEELSSLFENVIAVQRKAKIKSGKFLFYPQLSFDFSDAVYTMYGLNLNFGYAVGEFLEIYLNYVPAYSASERNISKKVREITTNTGDKAYISAEKAKSSTALALNWVPIYGKDSWGPYGVIRSDTFVNITVGNVKYEYSSGLQTKLSFGKTFFLSPWWNLRLQAGGSILESFSGYELGAVKKETVVIGLLEGGFVYYF